MDELSERLLAVIARGARDALPDEEFNRLALDLFAHQYGCNPIYRGFCDARRSTPDTVDHWPDIPAVPTDAFRAAALVCGDPADAAAVFRTSGTSAGRAERGTHYLLDARHYRASLREAFRHHLLRDIDRIRILSLVSPLTELPDSSLAFMLDDLMAQFGAPASGSFVSIAGIALPELRGAFQRADVDDVPVLVAGTSFAFVHLLDALTADGVAFVLPAGSRAMDTGGFKGRSREVGTGELYRGIEQRLGIPASRIVNEYGMTEMSSQFYDGTVGSAGAAGAARLHHGPPWVRSIAVDPETLEPLPAGELGALRHLDLANLDSIMALQTADLGRIVDGGIQLRGRAPGATVRGCSIAMDELLEIIAGR